MATFALLWLWVWMASGHQKLCRAGSQVGSLAYRYKERTCCDVVKALPWGRQEIQLALVVLEGVSLHDWLLSSDKACSAHGMKYASNNK